MKKLLFCKLLLAIVLLSVLLIPIRPLGSLGQMLNPYNGIWVETKNDFENLPSTLKLKLIDKVKVEFEASGIPHIFANNDSDLYYVQGYLQARDRLWEMDFFSRLASGRLSEIFGKKTLAIDETFVQLRIPEAALESEKEMLNDPLTKVATERFSDGVNFFIEHLNDSDLPLEFKIFQYSPEKWSPYKIALIQKFMAFNLSGGSKDLPLTRSRGLFSKKDFDELFPEEFKYKESILSQNTKWKLKPRIPKSPQNEFHAELKNQSLKLEPNPSNGSNNWSVFGTKSATGLPIVSNDIHLDYTLPALWYQTQLITPDQNVYGASLAGAPGVIVGFSKQMTWAVTNASGDFMDWYELKFRDEKHNEYLFDQKWRVVEEHEHIIKIRGEQPKKLILKNTHFGPIIFDDQEPPSVRNFPHGLALQWTGLKASNELKSILKLNRVKTTTDCQLALIGYSSPAQNFICADSSGKVQMLQYGEFPLRFKGQGRMIGDGSDSNYLWHESLKPEEYAGETNPTRGFVFSANQQPMNSNYPYYLGSYYESPFRAQRIEQLLREKKIWTPIELAEMQKDTFNKLAEKVLPNLISELGKVKLPEYENKILNILQTWDYQNNTDSIGASIFTAFWEHLASNIWNEVFPDAINYLHPNDFTTSELIAKDLKSKWLNPKHLSFEAIVDRSFKEAIAELEKNYGNKIDAWLWQNESKAILAHLSKLPVFSTAIQSSGSRYSILANSGRHGPVWKMLVSLGPDFKAWAIYPGGQSGDLRSPHAKEFLEDWSKSQLRPVQFLERADGKSFKNILFVGEK